MHKVCFNARALPRLAATLFTLLLSTVAASASSYTFINIADNTGPLDQFDLHPSINAGGTAAFSVHSDFDQGQDPFVLAGNGGPTVTIAAPNSPFTPGRVSINNVGTVAFTDPETSTIRTGNGGPTTPIYSLGVGGGGIGYPSINNAGTVAFFANAFGSDGGIFTGNGGPISTIVDESGPFSFFDDPMINDAGTAVFRGVLDTAVRGVFTGSVGGPTSTIADSTGPFSDFGTLPSINSLGTVAFVADLDAGGQGIFTGSGGPTTPVVTTAGPYLFFTDPSINTAGTIAFYAILDDSEEGIFTGPDPVADKVIQTSDALFGSTLTFATMTRGINDNGDIAFFYQLANGASGIAVAQVSSHVYYWDINGPTAGGGGNAPAGNWDGVAANFNTDPAGGGAGAFVASPTSADTVVFAAGSDATGTYTVTVPGTRTAAAVNIEEGNVTLTGGTISTPAFDVAAGATGTVTSTVTGPSGSVSKTGPGTLQLTRLPQNNAMTINGGTLRVLESTPGLGSGHPSGNDASVSRPSSLAISPGATLDLTNNDLILDYSGPSPVADIEALVASGYNVTGDWAGAGITSSVAALDGNYVLAIADNAALAAPFGTAQGGPLFAGVDVDLTTILIKFTHRADINLDGLITPDDSAVFGGAYDENQPAVWATGDMNYDGIFTPDDAAIFGGAYDESLASLPEPASIALLAIAGLTMSRRRRIRTR